MTSKEKNRLVDVGYFESFGCSGAGEREEESQEVAGGVQLQLKIEGGGVVI